MLNSVDKNKFIRTASVIVITINLSTKLDLALLTSNLSKLYVFMFKVLFESDYILHIYILSVNASKYVLLKLR